MAGDPPTVESLQTLVEELSTRAEERDAACIELSELSELIQEGELREEDAQYLQEQLTERGVEVRDDCGRNEVEQTTYVNNDLASQTTDAMALFLQEVRRYP